MRKLFIEWNWVILSFHAVIYGYSIANLKTNLNLKFSLLLANIITILLILFKKCITLKELYMLTFSISYFFILVKY